MIGANYSTKANTKYSYIEPPADLMYGFRGSQHNVDLMSPFEMWRFWRIEKVLPPSQNTNISKCTAKGEQYARQRREKDNTADLQPNVHYIAQPGDDRVMLQEIAAIGSLPDRFMWVKRRVPVVLVWSYAKLPNSRFGPEENCRLLSIYFRPWTLDPNTATAHNPLLSELRNSPSSSNEHLYDPAVLRTQPEDAASLIES